MKKHLYLKITFINISINILISIAFGIYYESYEGAISSFIHGTYSYSCSNFWDINNHFLTMRFYEFIQHYFPSYQVYGIAMYILYFITLVCCGLILFALQRSFYSKKIYLYIAVYSFLVAGNLFFLSSTRIAILSILFCLYLYNTFDTIQKPATIIILIVFTYISTIRLEISILITLLNIIILVILKRLSIKAFYPLLISLSLFGIMNYAISNYASEAKKVFIYKEKEIIDKQKFDFTNLNESTKLDLIAFIKYGVLDKEHFTYSFYNIIYDNYDSNKKNTTKIYTKIKNFIFGFFRTLKNSLTESSYSYIYILFFILSTILIYWKKKSIRQTLLAIIIILLPLILNIFTLVPDRFLIPYFSFFIAISFQKLLMYKKHYKYLLFILLTAQFFILKQSKAEKVKANTYFLNNFKKLSVLNNNKTTLFIYQFDYNSFLPVSPFTPLCKNNILFVNYFYHAAYDLYIDKWKDICNCNPLSLKEKIDYIIQSQSKIIMNKEQFDFLQLYLLTKYHLSIQKVRIDKFNNDLDICYLNYN